MRVLFFLAFMIVSGVFAQDTIVPLWPKDKIPNRIESDEKEEFLVHDGIQM